jgi:uncharacterized protein (DUF2141 family)
MKRIVFLSVGFLLLSASLFCQYSLEINITGIRNREGVIMLQLLNESGSIAAQEKGTIENGTSRMIIKDLTAGKYAVQYYQDENLDGLFDKNKLGIPTEGYGFSNNAYGMFGPKPFRDWLFEVKKDSVIILKIKY